MTRRLLRVALDDDGRKLIVLRRRRVTPDDPAVGLPVDALIVTAIVFVAAPAMWIGCAVLSGLLVSAWRAAGLL